MTNSICHNHYDCWALRWVPFGAFLVTTGYILVNINIRQISRCDGMGERITLLKKLQKTVRLGSGFRGDAPFYVFSPIAPIIGPVGREKLHMSQPN